LQGRVVPDAGNLLVLHAAGFHGLQAGPIVALLLRWAHTAVSVARRWVHLAGLVWLGACLAIAWQSGSGRAIVELSVSTAAAALCLLAFGGSPLFSPCGPGWAPGRPTPVANPRRRETEKKVVLDQRFVLDAWAICRFLSNL
jgi:hypothetical protein